MQIHESAEDYLEAILAIKEERGIVRSIDVSRHLGVTKPSVSRAMNLLRQNGYVVMEQDGSLTLTEQGHAIAASIYERHRVLTDWLIVLGVSPETAAADACRMEHSISEETFERLKAHIATELPQN